MSNGSAQISLKTKIFSLLLFALLVLPVAIAPQKSGQVLGVNEQKAGSVSEDNTDTQKTNPLSQIVPQWGDSTNENPKLEHKTTRLGQISSGIQEVKAIETKEPDLLEGLATLDPSLTTQVASDKFTLGTGIKVRYNEKTVNVVVSERKVLPPDTLIMIGQDLFKELGGDPQTQTSIKIVARKDY